MIEVPAMPSLPRPILVARLRNEVENARKRTRHIVLVDDPEFKQFPVTINITLRGAPGPVRRNGKVSQTDTHRLKLQVTQDYPYQKPIVQWMSEVFHPNIMTYSDGGFVCTRFLDDWTFNSELADFLRGLEALLQKPNPRSPYATCTCNDAAAYFLAEEARAAARTRGA
jgi:ubiquitin-protein ligase